MFKIFALASLSICTVAVSVAQANEFEFYSDAKDFNRPRCLRVPHQISNIFFRWNDKDRYSRTIEAQREFLPCSQWRLANVSSPLGWVSVPSAATSVFGVALSPEVRERFATIRLGGNLDRASTLTGAEYLRAHPISEFTLQTNRELTKAYGHGFAGAVYGAYVEAKPKNAAFREALDNQLKVEIEKGEAQSAEDLRREGAGTVLLVSMGLQWDKHVTKDTKKYVLDFLQSIESVGIPVEVLEHSSMGTIEENREALKPQIERHLKAGENVILFGMCKGVPEMLAATADLLAPTLTAARTQDQRPSGYGRITGVIDLSAMLSGIIFADYIDRVSSPAQELGKILEHVPLLTGVKEAGLYLDVLPDLTSKNVARLKSQFLRHLPADAMYVSGIGVVPGNALLENDTTAMAPFISADRKLNIVHAANDGFIAYPGNELPADIAEKNYAVIMSGSHMLSDGSFGPYSLQDQYYDRALYRAMIHLILQSN